MVVETILYSLLSAVVGGLIVAFANHQMAQRREARKTRADVSLKYRVEAWRAFEAIQGWDKDLKPLESAVADIILFGTNKEIDLVTKITPMLGSEGTTYTTELLIELRKNIRSDIGLSDTSVDHFWFRSQQNDKSFSHAETKKVDP